MNICCPNACEAAITVRDEDETVIYKDRASDTMWEWHDFIVTVKVPVFFCERCGDGWTDYRAEDIKTYAINADKVAREIDYQVVQEIKSQKVVDS